MILILIPTCSPQGMNCLTEMYSAVEAEVPVRTDPSTTRNEELLMELRKARRVR